MHFHDQEIQLLQREKILANLPVELREKISVEIFSELPSTNTYLLEKINTDFSAPVFCLAEQQTAGKGRMGRQWYSPFAQNIYLSCRWDLACDLQQLTGLSLVIGLAVIECLTPYDKTNVLKIKWPNDIMAGDKKLGGILIENIVKKECVSVVIGIGLNINMTDEAINITRPWTSLQQVISVKVDRNRLVSQLIVSIVNYLQQFFAEGLIAFKTQWLHHDALCGKVVQLTQKNELLTGKVLGIDDMGHLLLEKNDQTVVCCVAGETSFHLPDS
jgi:BirA family biotin operon repressor/biotin-[acetyl-CoA-carboxylase] ligase